MKTCVKELGFYNERACVNIPIILLVLCRDE